MLPVRKKVFGSTPFSKGIAGVQGGALRDASEKGWHTVSIDLPPKINGSGIPDSLPFHKKYVAHPQKSFRIDPFFKRGRRGAGRGPAKRTGCRAGTLRKELGGDRKENDEKHFIGFFRSAFHRFLEKFFYFCQGILFKP